MIEGSDTPTHYELLGVSPSADAEVIKAAFRVKMRKAHPDTNPNVDPELSVRLNAAYDVLSDPVRRREYDETLSRGSNVADDVDDWDDMTTFEARPFTGEPPPTPHTQPQPPRPPYVPRPPRTPPPTVVTTGPVVLTNPPALPGLILGVLGLTCLGPLGSVPAVVLGGSGLKRARQGAPRGGMSVIALVLGIVGLAVFALILGMSLYSAITSNFALRAPGSAQPTTAVPSAAENPPAAGTCAIVVKAKQARPDPKCTPGALVGKANDYPMCKRNFKPERPTAPEAQAIKSAAAAAYSTQLLKYTSEDIALLIPADLGGTWDLDNLWPAPTPLTGEQVAVILDRMCSDPRRLTIDDVVRSARQGNLASLAK